MAQQVSILVLDYQRPEESRLCLQSIKNNCPIEHETIYTCNGGENQDYAFQFYKEGLIDKLLINKQNNGGGFGTVQLVNDSFNKYILWIECDCEIGYKLDEDLLNKFIQALENGYSCIDLTGGICGQGNYSGRAFFMKRELYNSIPKDENGLYGGPGPFNNVKYLEAFINEYFKKNNLKVAHIPFVKDNGKWSIREIGDGIYKHRCDTKNLFIVKQPTFKTPEYPPFDDSDWELALSGNWPVEGKVPNIWKNNVFRVWPD